MRKLAPLTALLLAGCMTMEPAYVRPDPAVPASWPAGDAYLRQSEAELPAVTYRAIFRDARLQQLSLVRRPTGNIQVTEASPHLIPLDRVIGGVLQAGRSHRDRLHLFVRILVLLGKKHSEPRVQRLERLVLVDHPHSFGAGTIAAGSGQLPSYGGQLGTASSGDG